MKITIEIDDDEIRRLLAPLVQPASLLPPQALARLLTVKEVADRMGVSRSKVYQLILSGEIASLTIGRSRRVSPAAVAAYVAKPPNDVRAPTSSAPYQPDQPSARVKLSQAQPPTPEPPTRRRRLKPIGEIDLGPKPLTPDSWDRQRTDEEWAEHLAGLLEKGWLPDVVDEIDADRRDGVWRTYVMGINDAARYLGLTRYAVENLIKAGKLRLFTIAPTYRDEKPQQRIPAKDILALG